MTEKSKAMTEVATRTPAMDVDPIEIREDGGVDHSVTGVVTKGEVDGVVELAVPNLLPTDNATEVYEIPIHRLKVPVRVTNLDVYVVDNGFKVRLPHAGRQGMFGPDGAEHVFTGENAKAKMLEFVGMVIGQVTYQYREVEADDYHLIKDRMEGNHVRRRREARAERQRQAQESEGVDAQRQAVPSEDVQESSG